MEIPSVASIRWQCRRGMLELDLLLLPFVDKIYQTLSLEQQQAFIELLTYPDQTLYEWFIAKSEPSLSRLAELVKLIRAGSWKE